MSQAGQPSCVTSLTLDSETGWTQGLESSQNNPFLIPSMHQLLPLRRPTPMGSGPWPEANAQ